MFGLLHYVPLYFYRASLTKRGIAKRDVLHLCAEVRCALYNLTILYFLAVTARYFPDILSKFSREFWELRIKNEELRIACIVCQSSCLRCQLSDNICQSSANRLPISRAHTKYAIPHSEFFIAEALLVLLYQQKLRICIIFAA